MKILYLSRWLPYPPNNGSKLRQYNLLKRLARHGHEIELVTFYDEDENFADAARHLAEFCRTVEGVMYHPFAPTTRQARLAFFDRRPRSVVATYRPEMAQLVDNRLAVCLPDWLIASEIDMAIYGLSAARHGVGTLLEELEVGVPYNRWRTAKSLPQRLRHRLTWWKLRGYIRELARYYRVFTVVSEQEQGLVAPLVKPNPVHVLPNGADLDFYDFQPYRATESVPRLIFNGSLKFSLNRDAVIFFLNDIFPLVRQAEPDLRLLITGAYDGIVPTELVNGHVDHLQNVEFSGYVDDIRPLVAQSAVCVVPLLAGGGTRLKILEAFALGTPVVATTKAAEGLNVQPGVHLLVADSPAKFAAAVLRLYRTPDLAAELSINARRLVADFYSWDSVVASLNERLTDGKSLVRSR